MRRHRICNSRGRQKRLDFERGFPLALQARRGTGSSSISRRIHGRVPLKEVAVSAKPMPLDMFNKDGNFVSPKFIDYIKPLAGELPEFVQLEKTFAKIK